MRCGGAGAAGAGGVAAVVFCVTFGLCYILVTVLGLVGGATGGRRLC